jgi:hypothetical protein
MVATHLQPQHKETAVSTLPHLLYPHYTPGTHLGGPKEPVWTGKENLPSLGFNTQTIWPKACCYTDHAIPAICRIYTDFLV